MNETCTEPECQAPAVCEYGWGAGLRRACAGHDPLRSPYGLTVRVPPYYRTTGFPVVAAGGWVPAYQAYAGLRVGNRSIHWDSHSIPWDTYTEAAPAGCICTRFGPGTVPCPVHQPAPTITVTC